MKKYKIVIVALLYLCLLTHNSYAHSGRTDSNGGHRDKNNISGLGSYHYHCGGYPAHLHPNGVCPYSSSSSSSNTNNSSSKETNSKVSANEKSTSIKKSIEENKTNNSNDNKDDSNIIGTIIALAAIGGGGYVGYKKSI